MYPVPTYNNVPFNFRKDPYVVPAYNGVEFNFVEVSTYMELGASHQTVGLSLQIPLHSDRFVLDAYGYQTMPALVKWVVSTFTTQEFKQIAQWITDYAPFYLVTFTKRWLTNRTELQTPALTTRWSTSKITSGDATFKLTEKWGLAGISAQIYKQTDRWSTIKVDTQNTPFNVYWDTDTNSYGVSIFSESHAENGVTFDAIVHQDYYGVLVPSYVVSLFSDTFSFNYMVANQLIISYREQVRYSFKAKYQLGYAKVRQQTVVTSPLLTKVAQQSVINYKIKTKNSVRDSLSFKYSILDGSAIVGTTPPTVMVGGKEIETESVEISMDEGDFVWTCNLSLVDPNDYLLFPPGTSFTVVFGSETYSFVSEDPSLSREGQVEFRVSVRGLSPSKTYADYTATKITKTWDQATLVSSILDEVFGNGVVTLNVLDWSVPATKLSVEDQTPVEIATSLATATGGVLESDIDGDLYIRYLYPVSVLDFGSATPDFLYDDTQQAFSIEERISGNRIENKIRVLDVSDTAGKLSAEIDGRSDGYNKGKTQFQPGDQPAFLIFKTSDVEITNVLPSAGNIQTLDGSTMEVEETITFSNTTESSIRYPTSSLTSYKWLGNNLGVPSVVDETKVVVPTSGVGVLMVTYNTAFAARKLTGVPSELNGEPEYSVLVVVEGNNAD